MLKIQLSKRNRNDKSKTLGSQSFLLLILLEFSSNREVIEKEEKELVDKESASINNKC